jgi:hypothetical protein
MATMPVVSEAAEVVDENVPVVDVVLAPAPLPTLNVDDVFSESSDVVKDLGSEKQNAEPTISPPVSAVSGPIEKSPLSTIPSSARLSAPFYPVLPETPITGSFPRLAPLPVALSQADIDPQAARERFPYSDTEEKDLADVVVEPGIMDGEDDIFSSDHASYPSPDRPSPDLLSPTTIASEKQLPSTFRSAQFHTLPSWFPVSDVVVAVASFVLLSATILGVFVYNIVEAVRS